MKRAFVFFLLLCFGMAGSRVEAASGTEGASFLDIPVGAGPAAMGSAYSATAKDAYAPIYNPAGLGFVLHPQLAAQHLSYLESIHYEFGSLVLPLGPAKALGTSMQYLGSGDIAATGPDHGESLGDFSVHYAAYSLAYGQKVTDTLALGVTGKIIDGKIADVSAHAYAADAGLLYQPTEKLAFSATANNLGSKLTFSGQKDSLPSAYHLGAAIRLQNSLKSTIEGVYSKTGLLSGRTGVEWSPLDMISLRAGYKTETTKGLSPLAGLTAGIGLRVLGQEFAYAWLPYGDLGDTQYFSMLIKFGAQDDERRNLIQYQSIQKHRTVKGTNPGHDNVERSDPEYQQLMQLLSDEPDRNALAPVVRTGQ